MLDPKLSIFETVQSDAELIRELRITVPGGISQSELARLLGYSGASMISAVERGERDLSSDAILRLGVRWPEYVPALAARIVQKDYEAMGVWSAIRDSKLTADQIARQVKAAHTMRAHWATIIEHMESMEPTE